MTFEQDASAKIEAFKSQNPNPTRDELEAFASQWGKITYDSPTIDYLNRQFVARTLESAFQDFFVEGPLEEVDADERFTGVMSFCISLRSDWFGVAEFNEDGEIVPIDPDA